MLIERSELPGKARAPRPRVDSRTQRFQSRDGSRSVTVLDLAGESRWRQRMERQLESLVSPAVGVDLPAEVALSHQRARSEPLDRLVDRRRHPRRAENGGTPGTEDAGLLRADGLECIAEPLAVIETDRSEHRHVRVDEVRGIQTAAEADLEHRSLDAGIRENHERR